MTDTAMDGHREGKTKKWTAILLELFTTFVLAALGILPLPAIAVE